MPMQDTGRPPAPAQAQAPAPAPVPVPEPTKINIPDPSIQEDLDEILKSKSLEELREIMNDKTKIENIYYGKNIHRKLQI